MNVRILQGDVREMLATLEPESVQCVVTSPPYFRLRNYGVDGQIGMESTPAEFVATLVEVFEGVRRVLRPDGVVFCNLGDSYGGSAKSNKPGPNSDVGHRWRGSDEQLSRTPGRPKSLLLIPQRFAIAMQDAGWIVRQEIVWAKRAPMPESVRDRCTSAWEPIYMFTKQGKYFWDQDAVRVPHSRDWSNSSHGTRVQAGVPGHPPPHRGLTHETSPNEAGANLRNVWDLSPEPSRENHYAAFPTEIPRRCILAATSEKGACADCGAPYTRVTERPKPPAVEASELDRYGTGEHGVHRKVGGQYQKWLDANPKQTADWRPTCTHDAPVVPCVVLDPFLGSGTTALVADQLGRNAIGIELNAEYAAMAHRRITGDAPLLTDVEIDARAHVAAHETTQAQLWEVA